MSGLLPYQQCTYYNDCAITSVFHFCKSESLDKVAIKVYIFLPEPLSNFTYFLFDFYPQLVFCDQQDSELNVV